MCVLFKVIFRELIIITCTSLGLLCVDVSAVSVTHVNDLSLFPQRSVRRDAGMGAAVWLLESAAVQTDGQAEPATQVGDDTDLQTLICICKICIIYVYARLFNCSRIRFLSCSYYMLLYVCKSISLLKIDKIKPVISPPSVCSCV